MPTTRSGGGEGWGGGKAGSVVSAPHYSAVFDVGALEHEVEYGGWRAHASPVLRILLESVQLINTQRCRFPFDGALS